MKQIYCYVKKIEKLRNGQVMAVLGA